MTESEIRRLIRKSIREELAQILMGTVVSNQDQFRLTAQRFTTEAPIGNMRRIQPFGVATRAPAGTPSLIVPINGDGTHLNSVGDFDSNRPTLNDGESILYDAYGHIIYLSESKVQFGSKSADQNLVLGQVFKTMMDNLLTQLQEETHIDSLGYETSVPVNADQYQAIQESPIDDETILSQVVFTE